MDKHIFAVFAKYFGDEQSYQGDINGHPKQVFVNNYNHYKRLARILVRKNIALCYLPFYTTHLC
jgi:hypothetical protein